jgi:hypothetical protein
MDLLDNAMRLLNDRTATIMLATASRGGTINLTTILAVKAPEQNVILLAQPRGTQIEEELLHNLETGSLISVLCASASAQRETAYQVICSVKEFQTTGPLYEKFIDVLRMRTVDLKGVWVLEPVDVIDRSHF